MKDREKNVFDWLDGVRARPGRYVGNKSLRELEMLVWGYYAGLGVHGIVEPVPQMANHFLKWLECRTDWQCNLGWAWAIDHHHPESDKAFDAFFELVDEYRKLKPTTLCTVRLGPKHNPTGKCRVIGMAGRMEKPCRVDVVRYRPEPLHFLRFHYPNRVEDNWFLMTGKGEHATTLKFAKRWVRDELQVEFDAWEHVPKGGGR